MKHISNCISLSCDKGWMSDSTKRVDDIYRIKPLISTPISPRSLSPLSSFIHGSIEIHVFAWTFGHKTMIWKTMRISFHGYQSSKSTSFSSFSSPSFTRSNFITPMQSGTLSIVMYLVRKGSSDAFTQNLGWFENNYVHSWSSTRWNNLFIHYNCSHPNQHHENPPGNLVSTELCDHSVPGHPLNLHDNILNVDLSLAAPPSIYLCCRLVNKLVPIHRHNRAGGKEVELCKYRSKFLVSRSAAALPHFPLVRGDFVEPLPDPELEVDSPGCDGSRLKRWNKLFK